MKNPSQEPSQNNIVIMTVGTMRVNTGMIDTNSYDFIHSYPKGIIVCLMYKDNDNSFLSIL